MSTRLAWWLVAAALAACRASAPESPAQAPLRVMTFNIHAGKDAQQQPNLTRVAALIDSLQADVVLLQEVDRHTQRAGGADHLGELERLTGMAGAFGKSLDYQGGEYGIAVLSRAPIISTQVVPLAVDPPPERAGGSHEPRVALHVVIRTRGTDWHIINTHLDAARVGTFRRQELIGLLARARRNVALEQPLVLGGDLNARPESDEIAAVSLALRDAFVACGTGSGETFPAHAPDRRIDYLFLRHARCTTARVPVSEASDHRPFFAILQISREP